MSITWPGLLCAARSMLANVGLSAKAEPEKFDVTGASCSSWQLLDDQRASLRHLTCACRGAIPLPSWPPDVLCCCPGHYENPVDLLRPSARQGVGGSLTGTQARSRQSRRACALVDTRQPDRAPRTAAAIELLGPRCCRKRPRYSGCLTPCGERRRPCWSLS
jgi:hypothetical protein